MESFEKIKTEYMLKELEMTPTSRDTVLDVIDVYVKDLNKAERSLQGAISENESDKFFSPITNFFKSCFGFQCIDPIYYDGDTSILNMHGELARDFKSLFYRMQVNVTDENFLDMYKLVEFTSDKYLSNYNFLEHARDVLRLSFDGINYASDEFVNDKDAFLRFFEEEFRSVTASKGVEKVKK